MAALLIGCARCSTDQQDLAVQRDGLTALGVSPARVRRPRVDGHQPETARATRSPAACREGDTLVVTKTDRLARSLPDVRAIVDGLAARQRSSRLPGSCRT